MSIMDVLKDDKSPGDNIPGVVAAIVTDNKDPENMGRVKVKFPWLSDENETDWVRPATFMAGPERGSFFLPEKGDEVLVAFDHGNKNCPYVIGALWNGKAKPPAANADGNNNTRQITSRCGHEIIFDDNSQGKKAKIEIHTAAGHKIIMDDSAGQESIHIQDKTGKNKMTIDAVKNSVTIESTGQLSIKAQMVEIEAASTMSLKSNGPVTVKGALIKLN